MSDSPESIATLSLIVALVAATAGPLVTMAIARFQIRMHKEQLEQQAAQFREQLLQQSGQAKQQVISPMRQQWINTLRDTVVEILSQATQLHLQDELPASTERMQLAAREAKLALLINPKEEDHRVLLQTVRFVVNSISHDKRHEFHEGHRRAVEMAQKVLKEEWEVTKRGET